MGRKSRHYRDESDPLLGSYSSHIAATTSSSVRFYAPPRNSNHDDSERSLAGTELSGSPVVAKGSDEADTSSPKMEKTDQSYISSRSPTRKKGGYRVHRVSYTAHNHVQVLFRMYGSALPQVFPFCVANILWAVVVDLMKNHQILDLTFHSSVGHSFMGLLVSFLVVSRSKISYDRFMDFRRHLATTYRTCREIAQMTTAYTFQTQTPKAKEWRNEVCYRTIMLFHVTMDALLWSSTERDKWTDEYFMYDDGQDFGTIMQHPDYLGYKMAVNEYRDLLNFVTLFIDAFHEFRVLIFTPYPFPLVQMTRVFLFFWVYSLPLVLLKEYRFWSSALILTFITFGFIGVEYVSMALDDPFADDTNDVDEHGMALLVYEDIYLAIYRTDGYSAACKLRERVLERYRQGRGLDCYRDDLKGYFFWEQHLPQDWNSDDSTPAEN